MSHRQQSRRQQNKTWVRGDPHQLASAAPVPAKRVWVRAEASPAAPQQLPPQQPAAQLASRLQNGTSSCAAERPQPAPAANRPQANSQLRGAGPGQPTPSDALSSWSASQTTLQQYVRKRPNQLALNAVARPRPAGGPATAAAAAQSPARRALHFQQALPRAIAGHAAALAVGASRRTPLAAASGAAAPAAVPPAAAVSSSRSPPAAAKAAKASKRWVRQDTAADGRTATAGNAGRTVLPVGSPAHWGSLSKTPLSAFRPRVPAWAARLGRRSGSRLQASALPTPSPGNIGGRRKPLSLRAQLRRAARTWRRSDTETAAAGSAAAGSTASAATLFGAASRSTPAAVRTAGGTTAAAAAAAAAPALHAGKAAGGRAGGRRASTLRRIGEHLYTVSRGKGGRTLQRQVAAPIPAAAATPAAVGTPPDQQVAAASSRKARYSVRGKHRKVLIRRLTGAAGAADTPAAFSASRKRKSRLGASGGGSAKKRRVVAAVKPRRSRLPPQIYCSEFCRTGRCSMRQTCRYVHDSSKVAVCPRWLQGRCTEEACPLQHQHRPELMPVCTFFLQGACGKADCPYLHVNLSADASVCEAFLRGWCPAGAACCQKHLTPDMVQQLRRERKMRAGAGGGAASRQGMAKVKRKKRNRYFLLDKDQAADGCQDIVDMEGAADGAMSPGSDESEVEDLVDGGLTLPDYVDL